MARLRELIKERGLTQRWVAQQIGIGEDHVNRWCAGKSPIKPEYIRPLAKVLRLRQKDLRDG